jgi:8-amino-7-oxononanoate synthase
LLVDEAHAIGVLGPTGAGLCEALGVTPDVRMGTLGKALGSFGAWVGTSRDTADWLLNRARSFVFSTSLPASACAAALAALDVLQARAPAPADDGWMVAALLHLPVSPTTSRRERLWQVITRFNDGLRALGQGGPAQSAIASVIFGTPERALAASQFLRERGVLAKAIRPPTVPDGTSRVRFTLCADHTDAHVDTALAALDDLLKGQR